MPTVEKIERDALNATLSVKISKEEYLPKWDADLRKMRQKIQMKGFRPGQTPLSVVKKFYGQQAMAESVNDLTIKELYKFLEEQKLDILFQPIPAEDQPRVRFSVSNPEDLEFRFDIGIRPKFEIKGISKTDKYEKYVLSNFEKLVEEDLVYARRRMGERTNPTEKIELDDVVKIAATELNPAAEPHTTTMTALISNIQNKNLQKQFLGKNVGDIVQFNARDLDKISTDKLFRKYILNLEDSDEKVVGDQFEGKIEEISRLIPAELNREFFDKYFGEGVVKTEVEAREKVAENIKKHYENQSDALLMRDIQANLIAENEFELPGEFIKRWIIANRENEDFDPNSINLPELLKTVRWQMIRDSILEEHKIEVTDADLRENFTKKVMGYFGAQMPNLPESIIESTVTRLMDDKKNRKETEDEIIFEKMFDVIKSQISTVEILISSEEMQQKINEANAQAGNKQDY